MENFSRFLTFREIAEMEKKNTLSKRAEPVRYSDKELNEFRKLVTDKLNETLADYELLKKTLSRQAENGTDDTGHTFKLNEDAADVLSKEEVAQLALRLKKFSEHLRNALLRIENKTYGICRITGQLIPKERLRAVPHTTLSIDAKLNMSHSLS